MYSAVEMYMQQNSHTVSEEVSHLKEEIETARREGGEERMEEGGREGEGREEEAGREESGRGDGCSGDDVRQLCEVVEISSVSDKLVALETKVEATLLRLSQ